MYFQELMISATSRVLPTATYLPKWHARPVGLYIYQCYPIVHGAEVWLLLYPVVSHYILIFRNGDHLFSLAIYVTVTFQSQWHT